MAFVSLTPAELKRNFDSQGIHLGDGALKYLMDTYDKNKDGSIDFPEFVEFLTGKPLTPEQLAVFNAGNRQETNSANGSISAFHRGYLDGYAKAYVEALSKATPTA